MIPGTHILGIPPFSRLMYRIHDGAVQLQSDAGWVLSTDYVRGRKDLVDWIDKQIANIQKPATEEGVTAMKAALERIRNAKDLEEIRGIVKELGA
jgi:hypothetical protein